MPSKRSFRRRVHLFAYGFVSVCSIVLGIVFTGYALFERQSVISKVWLAGPTTLAVGLVLCGKVIIDCNPESESDDEEVNNNVVDVSVSEKQSFEMQIIKDSSYSVDMYTIDSNKFNSLKKGNVPQTSKWEERCHHECDIWHLRKDSLLDLSPSCLNYSSYANEAYPDLDSHYNNCNALQPTEPPKSPQFLPTVHRSTNLKNVDNSLIYHGETFLFNDRQFLI